MKKCRSFSSYVDNIRKYHRSNQANVCLSMDFEIEFFETFQIERNFIEYSIFFLSRREHMSRSKMKFWASVIVAAIFSIFFLK